MYYITYVNSLLDFYNYVMIHRGRIITISRYHEITYIISEIGDNLWFAFDNYRCDFTKLIKLFNDKLGKNNYKYVHLELNKKQNSSEITNFIYKLKNMDFVS